MSDQLPVKKESEQVPVKVDEKSKRWVEKGPHVIFDNVTKVYWLKKDSWQDKGKFLNWHEAREFADKKNMRKIGGFDDWRLPTYDEAASLYEPKASNTCKGGGIIHLDPCFPEDSFKTQWLTGDTSTRRPRFDYSEGKLISVDEYSFGSVRVCRKEPVKRNDQIRQRN